MNFLKLLEKPPLYLLFLFAGPSVILIVLSLLLNIDVVTVPEGHQFEGKQTGYIQSINWSFTFTVLFPALVAGCAIVCQRTSYIIRRLPKNGMLWMNSQKIDSDELEAAWRSRRDQIMPTIIWLIFALAAVVCAQEWFNESFSPLITQASSRQFEPDWAAAAALGHSVNGGPYANVIFSFIAFSLQFLLLVFGLIGCAIIGVFSQFLYDASTDGVDGLLVLPDYKDDDRRKGFQLHTEFCQYAIGFFVVIFLIIYVSQLHNNFLRDPTHLTIFSYLADRFSVGLVGPENFDWATLLSMNASQNYSNIATAIAAALVILLGGMIVGYVLRAAAKNARDNAIDIFRSAAENQEGPSASEYAEAVASLKNMVVWPFGGKTTNILVFLVFFPILALLFDTVVVALVAALAVALVTRAFKSVSVLGVDPDQG